MKKTFLLLFFLFLSLLITACSQQNSLKEMTSLESDEEYFMKFIDSMGDTAILNKKPQKTAILFASYAQIWQISGGNVDVTVGDAVKRGFAGEDAVLVDDGSGHSVDIEAIVAARPDFVVTTADYPEQVSAAQILKKNGIPVAQFREENLSDYLYILNVFCNINENNDAYAKLGIAIEEEIKSIKERHQSNEEKITYLFIRAGSTAGATKAKTVANHFACGIIDDLGGKNIVDEEERLSENLSVEYILECQPEIIFFVAMSDETAAKAYVDELLKDNGWKNLDAVKNDRVYFLPQDYFNHKPNCSWAKAYEYIEDILY